MVFALIAAGILIWMFKPSHEHIGQWTPTTPAPQIRDVPHVDIKPPKVRAFAPKAKNKLDLPQDIKDDPDKYVLTSSLLPSDRSPVTFTTVIDAKTGDVQMFERHEPTPWLAVEQAGELRLDYGIKNGFERVARLTMRGELLQVKALHLGVHATLDTDGAWFAGAGVGWRW
ncbi:MAG: hypothetical protein AABY01_01085 [Nanoarchaeota archaeon]